VAENKPSQERAERKDLAEREIVLANAYGLHLRPAKGFVERARNFKSRVTVRKEGLAEEADGRSILSLLVLQAEKGSRLVIRCRGKDAAAACADLTDYLEHLPYLPGEAPPGVAPPPSPEGPERYPESYYPPETEK